jgi:hypothetical protein
MMQQAGGMDVNALMQRVRRLATLDTTVFDEVRGDASSTVPAVAVAVVGTLLFGAGGWLWWVIADLPDSGEIFFESLILGGLFSVGLWIAWMAIVYVMLTQVFRARADFQELLRVMGFAAAPLALGVLMFIPAIEFGIALTVVALFFGTTVLAVQAATDAAPGQVLVANAAGFLVWSVVLGLLVSGGDNVLGPGIFVFDAGVEILKDIGEFSSIF